MREYLSKLESDPACKSIAQPSPFRCKCCNAELGKSVSSKKLSVKTCGVQVDINTKATLICECGCIRRWYAWRGGRD